MNLYSDNFLNKTITEENSTENFHPYATSHRAGEDSIIYADKKGDIEGYVLRLSNSFGYSKIKNENAWQLVVNNFCLQAIKEKIINIKSNTIQVRNFISIHNVCNCIDHIINYNRPLNYFDLFDNSIFNLGSNISYNIIDLAEFISIRYEKLFHQKIYVNKKNLSCNENLTFVFSQKKINKLGFYANLNFSEEIDLLLIKINNIE